MAHVRENDRDFRRQSYWRLISYTRPYWLRLSIGIFAGMLVGGSLFVTLLMIPKLVGVADSGVMLNRSSQLAAEIVQAVDRPGLDQAARIAAAEKILSPGDDDPKLTQLLKQAQSTADSLHLPFRVDGQHIEVYWPRNFSFDVVGPDGRVAWQLFAIYTVVFVLAWLLKNVAHYVNGYCTRWVGSRVVADLREAIFRKLIRQSLGFYSEMDIGHLISCSTNDTSALEYSVAHSIEDLTNAPLQLLGCLAAIIVACREYNSYALVLILVIGMPLLVLPIHILGRRIRKLYKKTFAKIADVFSRMHEVFSGIRVVKSYHTEEAEVRRFVNINNRYFRQVVRAMRLQILVSPVMELFAVTAALCFLLYSYSQGVTITQLAALLSPAFMAYRPIKDLSKVVASIQQSMAAADRFFHLLDVNTELPEKSDAVELREFQRGIRFENVDFSYGEKAVIRQVSFEVPRGKVVAVVGETGSGKTTLANLLARFYDVTGGRVTIDGVDVRDYSIASLRDKIGVVNQEPILFNESIAANIAYGSPEATMDDIVRAAKLANAHEFIVSGRHPEGYETNVGEKGFKLSGGEKQRVVIARAILRNPPILILDEATSALDTVTERLVQEALNRVMDNRTVFAIAHRLSTIQNADLIIVLRNGEIIESGTHRELLALNGVYRKLHDTQFA